MQFGYSVYCMAAHGGKVGHPYISFAVFINKRNTPEYPFIIGVQISHFSEEAAIDLINDFKMPWQKRSEQADGPFFECLRQQGMICIGKCFLGNSPGIIPIHLLFIYQYPHEFCHADGWMGVI